MLRSLTLALLLVSGSALAQTSSQKSIQILVPFAPGASSDGISRIIANELGPRLNRQMVVENKPGAGGTLGLMTLAKAAPDGDTLGVGATGALVISPHLAGAPPFDPLRELTPIAKLIDVPLVIVANPAVGPKSIKEMIERSKTTPGGITYGSTGTNSGQHLTMELLKKATGANLVHVAYRGSAPAVTDLVGGQIPLAVVDLTSAHPHIKAGTLIALARAAYAADRDGARNPDRRRSRGRGLRTHRRLHRDVCSGRNARSSRQASLTGGRNDPRGAAGSGQSSIALGRAGLRG